MAFGRVSRLDLNERRVIIALDDPADDNQPEAVAWEKDFLSNHWQNLINARDGELPNLRLEFSLVSRDGKAPHAREVIILPSN